MVTLFYCTFSLFFSSPTLTLVEKLFLFYFVEKIKILNILIFNKYQFIPNVFFSVNKHSYVSKFEIT